MSEKLADPTVQTPPTPKPFPHLTVLLSLLTVLLFITTASLHYQNKQLQKQIILTKANTTENQIHPLPTSTLADSPSVNELPIISINPQTKWKRYTLPSFFIEVPPEWPDDPYANVNPLQLENFDPRKMPGRELTPNEYKGLLKIEIYTDSSEQSLRSYIDKQKKVTMEIRGQEEISWLETPTLVDHQPAIKVKSGPTGYWIAVVDPIKHHIISISFGLDFDNYPALANQILSTFKFVNTPGATSTCTPRPACLDMEPRCLIPETTDMCPPKQNVSGKSCTVNGVTYQNGESFRNDCNSCSCINGEAACTLMACID